MSRAVKTCSKSYLAIDRDIDAHHVRGLDDTTITSISFGPLIVLVSHGVHADHNSMNRGDGSLVISPWSFVASVHRIETACLAVVVVTANGIVRVAEVVIIIAHISVFILPRWLWYVGVDLLRDSQYPVYIYKMLLREVCPTQLQGEEITDLQLRW